ncbi:MAG: hypothetical protein KF822_12420 [Steroidobacteraceae bacterium]|nr:hypothetical protein [Steroidobacteraceae bacterium]
MTMPKKDTTASKRPAAKKQPARKAPAAKREADSGAEQKPWHGYRRATPSGRAHG